MRAKRTMALLVGAAWGALVLSAPGVRAVFAGDFASSVIEYVPAPGQFVNSPNNVGQFFNDPARALGPPVGGGLAAPDNSKCVSLGGFAGSITLRFEQTVLDDPCNPFGLDAIVFGNAFWTGADPNLSHAEPGVVEISRDANHNGLADDPWFLIPGGLIPNSPPTVVPNDALVTQAWDNDGATSTPPANTGWYPDEGLYDFVPPGFPSSYQTTGWLLPTGGRAPGYADQSPILILGDTDADDVVEDAMLTPGAFYTRPDNPWAMGITPGSGGGDAFDIAWAVDPATGERTNLEGFDFVRISTGERAVQGVLGEKSTEIGAVSDVRPDESFFDVDGSGGVDVEDLYRWHADPTDLSGEGVADETDRWMLMRCARHAEIADMTGVR